MRATHGSSHIELVIDDGQIMSSTILNLSIKLSLKLSQVNQIIIPTVDTTRQKYLLLKFIENNCPALIIGPTGTGKSAITNNFILSLPAEKLVAVPF